MLVNDGIQNLIHHAEVTIVSRKLGFEVNKVSHNRIHPGGDNPRYVEGHFRVFLQESLIILNHLQDTSGVCHDRGGCRAVQQIGHFPKDCARRVYLVDMNALLGDSHRPGLQEIQPTGRLALCYDDFVRLEFPLGQLA